MAGISKAGKAYRELIETLAQARAGYRLKDTTKELAPVKGAMRALKPEAYEDLRSLTARPALEARELMGETSGSWVSLNPSRSRNYGLDEETFFHEMGHHLAYADKTHPLSALLSSKKNLDRLPEKTRNRMLDLVENDADRFMGNAVKRMKGGEKDPKDPMSKWLKSIAVGTAGALGLSAASPEEAKAGVLKTIAKSTRKLAQLVKDPDPSAVVRGARPLKELEQIAYHSTSPEAARRIEREGIRPLAARMSKAEAEELSNELMMGKAKDRYTDYSYTSLDPKESHNAAVAGGAQFEVNLRNPKIRARSVINPEFEGGLVMTRGGVPKSALRRLFGGAASMGGSMGILDLLQPSEAEAMPRGVYQAIGKGVLSKEVSSAAKVLVGKVLDGKTIKDVRKGEGTWRAILFDDESMMTVTNTELNDLSRAFGSQKYTKEFIEKEGPSKTEQAIKSLDYHYARVKPLSTKTLIEQHHHMHRERLKEMGGSTPDFSLVLYKGKYFTMPKVYAEHLQDLGMLQIKKDAK